MPSAFSPTLPSRAEPLPPHGYLSLVLLGTNARFRKVIWRVVLFNFDGHPPPGELTSSFQPRSMGPAGYVRASISALLCDVDWSDPRAGTFEDGAFLMRLRLPAGDVVDRVDVEIVGEGNPVPALSHLCLVNGWFAYDIGERVFLDPDEPRASGWEASLRSPRN